jgi:hypothetical protein
LNAARPVVVAVMILPAALIHGLSLIIFQYTSPFVFLGIFSLIMILLSDRIKWGGILTVYLPAAYSIYILVVGGNPVPFISLASGYILAMPLVLIISMITARTPAALIGSYFTAYTSSLILYGAVYAGYNSPEKLFIYLVRGLAAYIGSAESISLIPPENPSTALLATPTAASTIALIIRLMTITKPDRQVPEGPWIAALIQALVLGIPLGITALINPSFTAIAVLITASLSLAFLALYSRRRVE